jgi:hypothetical protein
MEIAGGTNEVDCRAQLLVTEAALMLFPALKPGPGYHATGTNQGTDQHGQAGVGGASITLRERAIRSAIRPDSGWAQCGLASGPQRG